MDVKKNIKSDIILFLDTYSIKIIQSIQKKSFLDMIFTFQVAANQKVKYKNIWASNNEFEINGLVNTTSGCGKKFNKYGSLNTSINVVKLNTS